MRSRIADLPEALASGLVNCAAPLGELQVATDVLLTRILSKPRLALGKQLFYRQLEVGMQAACNMKDAAAPWGR